MIDLLVFQLLENLAFDEEVTFTKDIDVIRICRRNRAGRESTYLISRLVVQCLKVPGDVIAHALWKTAIEVRGE